MMLRNPYGGARGRFTAAAAPRQLAGGEVEIDAEDGRIGRFRAGYLLDLDWRAMDDRQAQEAVAEDGAAPCRDCGSGPGHVTRSSRELLHRPADPEAEAEAG